MKNLVIAIFILIVFSPNAGAVPIYSTITGHYYERIDFPVGMPSDQKKWHSSKLQAELMTFMGVSGYLATITTEEENLWIVENLGGELILDHWLGGYRADNDDRWEWISGETWSYDNWFPGEPNAPRDQEVGLEFDDDETIPAVQGYWNDMGVHASDGDGFIAEWDTPNPVPEPATMLLLGSGLIGLLGYKRKFR